MMSRRAFAAAALLAVSVVLHAVVVTGMAGRLGAGGGAPPPSKTSPMGESMLMCRSIVVRLPRGEVVAFLQIESLATRGGERAQT
jgi:hypothetical protein